MSSPGEYHPDVLTQIMSRLDEQDRLTTTLVKQQEELTMRHHQENKEKLTEIKEQVVKTNGRVTRLEAWRNVLTGGWIVGIGAFLVLAWVVERLMEAYIAFKGHVG